MIAATDGNFAQTNLTINIYTMGLIIMILVLPFWLLEALRDGRDIK